MAIIISSCGGKKKVISNKKDNDVVLNNTEVLETQTSEINNKKLYSFIDEWSGTKYKYGGTSKDGVDCSGFCSILYHNVYNKEIQRSTSDLSKAIIKKEKNKLKEGDLVFFNISGKMNSHVGVYLKNNMFVHASTSKGVIISSLDNPYYIKTYSIGGSL